MADYSIDHESGVIGDYYDSFTLVDGGAISVSAAAAMNNTDFGLQATVAGGVNDEAIANKEFATGPQGTSYILSLYFDPNGISMPTPGANQEPLLIRDDLNNDLGFLLITYSGGHQIHFYWYDDDRNVFFNAVGVPIVDDAQFIEIVITKASDEVSADGSAVLKIDSFTKVTHNNLDLFTSYSSLKKLLVGSRGTELNTIGTWYIDEIELTSSPPAAYQETLVTPGNYIADQGPGADGGEGGSLGGSGRFGGAGGIADISADGEYIYIASFNVFGNPILIQMATALDADGTIVFNTGDGGRISVLCGRYNDDHIWIGGSFGGSDKVEKSEDAGTSWTVKNPASMGTVRTFVVGPDDTRVLVFDGDNGDLIETTDDGETWTTTNAAVTPLVNSLARLDINPEEIVLGNEGDATNSINYSPNTGVNLADYQVAPYPNVDAAMVVVV